MRCTRLAAIALCCSVLSPFASHAGASDGFLIAEGSQPRCVIVVGDEPIPAERTAAAELQAFLTQVTGAELPIRPAAEVARDSRQIVVGPSRRLTELLPELDLDAVGDDGIVMHTVGNALILAGPRPRGTLYAVYTLLEDHVGCRWWTSTESTIPSKSTLRIPPLDVVYAPKLKSRMSHYRDAREGPFAARLKINGNGVKLTEEHGGRIAWAAFVHTFNRFLPPHKYFDGHPEWYSLIDGQRTADRAQLCLTNDAMCEEFTRNVLAFLRERPESRVVSISQNDWRNPCQCERCQAVAEREGSESGPMLHFVNAVAANIEREFPDVWVSTLAYQYTRKAPKHVRPRHNVVVRLCSIECSFVDPLGGEAYGGGDENTAFRRDMKAWSQVAPRLFVWNYVTNFSNYLVPHPNWPVLGPNIRFFVEHNVIGLFEQGDVHTSVGDFVRLRAWLLAHLMWNPEADQQALIDEFLTGYYGPAAPHLRAYIELISDAGQELGEPIRCFEPETSAWLSLDHLNRATELFDAAERAVADSPTKLDRVRRARLPLMHVWLWRWNGLRRVAKLEGKPFRGPADPLPALDEMIEIARENQTDRWCEWHPLDERIEAIRARLAESVNPPVQVDGLDETAWVDFQDSAFQIAVRGGLARRIEDPAASDGRAVRMPGGHREWAVRVTLSEDLTVGNPWRVYIVVRSEGPATDGPGLSAGIYDGGAGQGVTSRRVAVERVKSPDYQTIDLGAHRLDGNMCIWIAPPERPDEVEHIYIDRVFLVREK